MKASGLVRMGLCAGILVTTAACSQPKDTLETGSDPVAAEKKPAKVAEAKSPAPKIDASRTMGYVREIVAFGRRAPGSPGQKKQQAYIREKLKSDNLEEDVFTAETPVGKFELRNLIAKFPGSTDEIIVVASHYDTNYPLKNYVGANDGASSTALLLEAANHLRGKQLKGPAIWLVFFDGEEAFVNWSATDSLYGSRHLAEKWKKDGTTKKIKAFILADMIGDADLNIDRDGNSTPWLSELVLKAAMNLGHKSHFYGRSTSIEDDHIPFAKAGVPVVDLIDLDYGYGNVFHHSPEDTLDKLSPKSIKIVGDVILETLRLLGSG
ncbi:MAG TPA: M28 family peptidase [Terriglobales bacterium]|nr:M28 family peptidase [Terriglobales bacterium]